MPLEELDAWMTAAKVEDDHDSFARLVDDCHHMIRATVLRETANPELADEVAQDVFVTAWEKRAQYNEGSNPRAWLMTIARSRIMDVRRREDRNHRHLRDLVRHELLRHAAQWTQEDIHHAEQRAKAVQTCLQEVPPEHTELIRLVYGEECSTEDAAEILGIQPTTCRKRLSRLYQSLRACAEQRMEVHA